MATKRDFVRYSFLPREPNFTPLEAVTLARKLAESGARSCPHHSSVQGMCAHVAACTYGFLNCGFVDASSMWRGIPAKYKRHGIERMKEAPAGALLFWSGGSSGHGHAGIADGKGNLFGTDRPATGRIGRTPIGDIQATWGLKPEGWAFPYFELAGDDRRTPPAVKGKKKPRKTPNVDRFIACQQDAIAAAKRAVQARKRPEDDKLLRALITSSRASIKKARPLQAKKKA